MLTEICQYLRNWFERDTWFGDFNITNGVIAYANGVVLPLLNGQYYRVIGSVFNDGVHIYGTKEVQGQTVLIEPLVDEPSFDGAVWPMAVPPAILELDSDITAWIAANGDAINSPYTSESFGGYSYSLRSANGQAGENIGVTWQNQFGARLGPWRKI